VITKEGRCSHVRDRTSSQKQKDGAYRRTRINRSPKRKSNLVPIGGPSRKTIFSRGAAPINTKGFSRRKETKREKPVVKGTSLRGRSRRHGGCERFVRKGKLMALEGHRGRQLGEKKEGEGHAGNVGIRNVLVGHYTFKRNGERRAK